MDVEFFENSEILAWLADPYALRGSRVLNDPLLFNEFSALASDLCDEAPTVDTMAFTEMFVEASRSLGEAALLRWQPQFSPQAALEAVLRKEGNQEIRCRAVGLLLEGVSVWLSYRMIAIAHGDAIGFNQRSPRDAGDRLLENEANASQFDLRWTEAAITELSQMETPDPERPAFTLAWRILKLNGDRDRVRGAVTQIARDRPRGLAILFSGEAYGDEQIRNFGWDRLQDLISAMELLDALPRSPGFEDDHGKLVEIWRRSAGELSAAADLKLP